MGCIKHHTIIVTGFNYSYIEIAREYAVKKFAEAGCDTNLVSLIIKSNINGYCSFFIAPDGSKEGWDESNKGDLARKNFIDWLYKNRSEVFCDYVEVVFGGDDKYCKIVNSNEEE